MLLDAMLVAAAENGIEVPSSFVPRVVAASGNEFHTALAAGMMSIGKKHGGAAEQAAMILNFGKSAEQIVEENKIIAGFGHKIYKDEDPRAKILEQKTLELGFSGKYFGLAHEIQKVLMEKKGKKLPLNIDGALACCMLELGFDAKLGKALFLISRIVGMSAHV
jgi:citrate synthase